MRTREGSTRVTPPWLIGGAALLLVARVVLEAMASQTLPPVEDQVTWRTIPSGVAEAQATGKPLLFDFTADWCPPCRQMSAEVFADARSAETLENLFVPVRVLDRSREDGRNTPDVAALQSRFNVTGFPTLVVIGADGAGPPTVIEGFPGKQRLMTQLEAAAVKARFQRGMGGSSTPGAPRGGPGSPNRGSGR